MSDQDPPQMPGSSEPPLGRSLPQSANGSREGSISSPNIFATSAASGITMRCHIPGNGSSSGSSSSDEIITQERVRYERQIFHLQQQHAQMQQQHAQTQQQLAYTLHALDHMRSSGVSPSVAMPHIGNLPQTLPFMTNRVLDNQFQPPNSGTMNGTEYHSSVSACPQPVMTSNPISSPRQQVANSCASSTIWQSSQQPGTMRFAPLESNNFAANSQHGSAPRGMQSPVNSLLGGQVNMSMLEDDPNFFFAHLLQHRRDSSLEDVKREFFPILLRKICLTGVSQSEANQILHGILESSDSFEVLRMRCFDQVLHQRILESKHERVRFAGPKLLA